MRIQGLALKVLMVEDSSTVRTFVRQQLVSLGINNIVVALNSAEALAQLHRDQDINFVLCDLYMEGVDGLGFCAEVRRDANLRKRALPIVIMTGERDKMVLGVVRDLGVAAVLPKPFNTAQLKAVLAQGLGMSF